MTICANRKMYEKNCEVFAADERFSVTDHVIISASLLVLKGISIIFTELKKNLHFMNCFILMHGGTYELCFPCVNGFLQHSLVTCSC